MITYCGESFDSEKKKVTRLQMPETLLSRDQ
jgi:hypothetical protein